MANKGFEINGTGGVWMTFSNGWTVSIQSGIGSHSTDTSVEIAAWPDGEDSEMMEFADGDVIKGFVQMDEVADFIQFIKNKDGF